MSFIPPIIGRDAIGLLSLLDLKSGGRRPQQLAEFVQPVLDMMPFYLASAAKYGFGSTASNRAQGAIANLVTATPSASPDAGKLWFITKAAASRPCSSASWCDFALIVRPNTLSGLDVWLANATSATVGLSSGETPPNAMLGAVYHGLVLLRDEGDIAIKNGQGSGINPAVDVTWEYVELDV